MDVAPVAGAAAGAVTGAVTGAVAILPAQDIGPRNPGRFGHPGQFHDTIMVGVKITTAFVIATIAVPALLVSLIVASAVVLATVTTRLLGRLVARRGK